MVTRPLQPSPSRSPFFGGEENPVMAYEKAANRGCRVHSASTLILIIFASVPPGSSPAILSAGGGSEGVKWKKSGCISIHIND